MAINYLEIETENWKDEYYIKDRGGWKCVILVWEIREISRKMEKERDVTTWKNWLEEQKNTACVWNSLSLSASVYFSLFLFNA